MPASLAAVLESAFGLLAEGVADPASPFHTPTLASIAADGGPALRSVVLRGFDTATRCLEMHTDTRSAKYEGLSSAGPGRTLAALHVWDPARQVQLRARGEVTLHVGDAVAALAWRRLRPTSRATYCVAPGPGSVIAAPGETHGTEEADGLGVFCTMCVAIRQLEWLHLEHGSYARALFRWDNGKLTPMWLVP